jgi:hypothetical protein
MSFASLIKVVNFLLEGGYKNNNQLVKRGGMGQGSVNIVGIFGHVIDVL